MSPKSHFIGLRSTSLQVATCLALLGATMALAGCSGSVSGMDDSEVGTVTEKVLGGGSSGYRLAAFNGFDGTWAVDSNGDGIFTPGVDFGTNPNDPTKFGAPGDIPVAFTPGDNNTSLGEFFCTGNRHTVLAEYRPSTCQFFIDGNGDHEWTSADFANTITFNAPDCTISVPFVRQVLSRGQLCKSQVGLFKDGIWRVDANVNGQFDAGDATWVFGQTGDIPVPFRPLNANITSTLAVWRQSTGDFYVDTSLNHQLDPCGVDMCITGFGDQTQRGFASPRSLYIGTNDSFNNFIDNNNNYFWDGQSVDVQWNYGNYLQTRLLGIYN